MKRESKFELLRIVLICMVITLHYLNPEIGGALEYTKGTEINHVFALVLESICIIAVNVFVIITGYFGLKRMSQSLRKPFGLILLVIGYNLISRFVEVGMGEKALSINTILGIFIPANWYIIIYVALILIAPYINFLINSITKQQLEKLICLMFTIFVVWNTVFDILFDLFNIKMLGVSTITNNGSQSGYNIVNFILLYIIGSYIKKYNITIKIKYLLTIYISALFLTILMGNFTSTSWNYDNIFVIIMSVSFFVLWNQTVEIGNKRIINVIAKGTLGIYILHTKKVITEFLWGMFSIELYSHGGIVLFIINLLLCLVITYIICYVFDMLCRSIVRPISILLDRIKLLNSNIVQLGIKFDEGKKSE